MIRNLLDMLPAKLTQVDVHGGKKYLRAIVKAVRITRTHCTTLNEFHAFWNQFFDMMRSEWREAPAADYLAEWYFFKIPVEDAVQQYHITNFAASSKSFFCAAWWASYARVQPSSACGTQPLESYNSHGWRGNFYSACGKRQARKLVFDNRSVRRLNNRE